MSGSEHVMRVRVRYCETDAMGYMHHSHYVNLFEQGRTELLRSGGGNYRAIEERGLFFVVVDLQLKYRRPARYDDELELTTKLVRVSPAKIIHEYIVRRDGEVLTEGRSVLACVDREGLVQRVPEELGRRE